MSSNVHGVGVLRNRIVWRPHRVVAASIALLGLSVVSRASADDRCYSADTEISIRINWDTFVEQGIDDAWKSAFQHAVINAYTRWVQVGGARINPVFRGYTTETSPGANEIIVRMNEKHSTSTRLASRFGCPATVVFHRKRGSDNTLHNFVPYWANASEYDMQAILVHELGHAFGLEHEDDLPLATMNGAYSWHRQRFGPFSKDVEDLRAQYGARSDLRFKVKRSTDGGLTWADFASNIGTTAASTTIDPTATRDGTRTILFYTKAPDRRPAWIIGDSSGGTFNTGATVFGGYPSQYGTAGHGYSNEYMMTWVDSTNDDNIVKVVYSTDGGATWGWRNPPTSVTVGTPSVHKLSANEWILVYTRLDRADRTRTGQVVARLSSNDGATWGGEITVSSDLKTGQGVAASATGPGEIRIAFTSEARTTGSNYLIRTLRRAVSGSSLVVTGLMEGSTATRVRPVLGQPLQANFISLWRETNFNTSINSMTSALASNTWSNEVRLVESSPVSPAIATSGSLSFSYAYYLE